MNSFSQEREAEVKIYGSLFQGLEDGWRELKVGEGETGHLVKGKAVIISMTESVSSFGPQAGVSPFPLELESDVPLLCGL